MSGGWRIGIDAGGTKIEALALDARGVERLRRRIDSPAHDYAAFVEAIRALVLQVESAIGAAADVGIGMPGALSPATGLVMNSNSTSLNGRPFASDLERALGRPLRFANDADCLTLSEATDGAGRGHATVFGVILGTGVGGGIVHDGRLRRGRNAIAGEWGHNEMPARTSAPLPVTRCWCGRARCIETYLSGPALAADHRRSTGEHLTAREVAGRAAAGDDGARATLERHAERLACALASVVNLLDPDIVVLGGGLSRIAGLAASVEARLPAFVFADRGTTPVVPALHGDASGVRGAAWLWPAGSSPPTGGR